MEGEKVVAKEGVRSWKAMRTPRLRNSGSLLLARRNHGWVLSQGENTTSTAFLISGHQGIKWSNAKKRLETGSWLGNPPLSPFLFLSLYKNNKNAMLTSTFVKQSQPSHKRSKWACYPEMRGWPAAELFASSLCGVRRGARWRIHTLTFEVSHATGIHR